MKIIAVSHSTKGLLKKVNQDSILLKSHRTKTDNVWLAVVCDGVGGLDCGEFASSYVVEAFSMWFEKLTEGSYLDFAVSYNQQLKKIAKEVHAQLRDVATAKGRIVGTTLTSLLIFDDSYYVLHIGDTRIYFIDKESIVQMTKDHTEYERYLDRENFEVAKNIRKNVLWQCVGGSKNIEPQIFKGSVKSGIFLLCSDGFRDVVSEDELREIIGSAKPYTSARLKIALDKLIDLNLKRNEKDNISAILMAVEVN